MNDSEISEKSKALEPFGKIFMVKELLHFDKASAKTVGKKYPRSEVSAKNIPLSSDELRTRLGVASGDDAMIFGARIELPHAAGNYLIVCDRI